MPLKFSFRDMKLGAIYSQLAPFAKGGSEAEARLKDMLDLQIITLGQGGGRLGAELARFGFDSWMVNSASSDWSEQNWIDDGRKILLTDPERGKLEGTAKNAGIGHMIAQKNVQEFKKLALETQDADFLIVKVALGGGTGNGSLLTALEWISKVRDMASMRTERGNATIMVVASIPSRDEANPEIWRNTLSGIKVLQDFIDNKKIGTVLPVDNEFMRNFYEREQPLVHQQRTLSALDYSNVIVARTLFEALCIPLLGGQVAMDYTELVEIFSTPGWMTINRAEIHNQEELNVPLTIDSLFKQNEVFASLEVAKSLAGGIAVITGPRRKLSAASIDSIKPTTNELLGRPPVLHTAVLESNSINDNTSYVLGMSVTPSLPETLLDTLMQRYQQEKERREQLEAAARQTNSKLTGFDDVFSQAAATSQKKRITLDELELGDVQPAPKKRISIEDL
ncbi:hypothetical protein PV433_33640 [Paenibacillus sp. GYB004]|uniref:hypothetical protein n=1 Tax=Paenibacillus sp. GYB004 TaxID=2994393 RepID=UPI002F968E31